MADEGILVNPSDSLFHPFDTRGQAQRGLASTDGPAARASPRQVGPPRLRALTFPPRGGCPTSSCPQKDFPGLRRFSGTCELSKAHPIMYLAAENSLRCTSDP